MLNLLARTRSWFNYKYYRYSELGTMGNFTHLSLNELSLKLTRMHFEIISQNDQVIRVKIEDEFTRYIFRYNSEGQFVSVEEDSWKHF